MQSDPASDLGRTTSAGTIALHRSIYKEMVRELAEGVYRPGDRMPSEAALCERFGASRITVAKAIQALQRDGLVTRRAGSGTYVQQPVVAESHRFGLLIPQLGNTEIFEPICQGIMQAPLAKSHVLLWGHTSAGGESDRLGAVAEQLCRQFIDQKVSGVFFAPLEYKSDRETANRRIVELLAREKIATVLLDRCYERFPNRSGLDLVGIDNYRAGYAATQHLLEQNGRHPVFVARKHSASTIAQRIGGFEAAAARAKIKTHVCLGDVNDPAFVDSMLKAAHPDSIVCGNDLTAARLMRSLLDRGVRIPAEVRITGFDDVNYSQYLPIPLTTIHQDCSEIGRTALSLMLGRLAEPQRTALDVRVPFDLIVRQSSLNKSASPPASASTS